MSRDSRSHLEYMHFSGRPCPECQGPLDRVPRRIIDRLTSIFVSTQRYRCRSFSCRWEGNLRDTKSRSNGKENPAQ